LALGEARTDVWLVNASPTEPEVVWVYEAYADEAAKRVHESGEAYVRARARTGELLARPPEAIPLTPIAGKGLPAS